MEGVQVIEYHGMKVRVLQRADGRHKVYWREGRRAKSTTLMREEEAVKRAHKEARRLGSSRGGLVMSADDGALLKLVKQAAGTRSPFVWVNDAADAEKRLKGVATLGQAARHFEESGMIVVRVPLKVARVRFLGEYDASGADTGATMRKAINALWARFPDLDVLDLTPDLVKSFCGGRSEKGKVKSEKSRPVEAKTFNNRLGYVKTFLNKCREWKMLPQKVDHAAELVKRRKEGDKIPAIFTPEVAAAALRVLPEYLVPTFVVGNWMGPRPRAELRRIEWEDFDWGAHGHLHIRPEVARKTSRERYVPVPANVRVLLRRWISGKRGRQGDTETRRGEGKISGRQHIEKISKILRQAGIIKRWPADIMRHSYISYALAAGHGIGQVAEWAGTSEKKIRKNYRRPLRKQDAKKWAAVRTAAYLPLPVAVGARGRGRKFLDRIDKINKIEG